MRVQSRIPFILLASGLLVRNYRQWMSLKYEAVYLHELKDGVHVERIIRRLDTPKNLVISAMI